MSEATQTSMMLPYYQPPAHVFDELGRGLVPHHWQTVMAYFAGAKEVSGTPQPEQLRAEMLVRDLDVERPTRLDPLPFTISTQEWQMLEQGLSQRAQLLNQITADLYGPRTLLNVGGLPPALIYGNPRFLLPMFNYRTASGEYLHLIGFDVGRSPDGQWRVLADWTEAPQGLGMCLENRILAQRFLNG